MKNYIVGGIIVVILLAVLVTCHRCAPAANSPVWGAIDTFSFITEGGDIVSAEKGSPEAFAQLHQRVADSVAKVYKTSVADLQEYIIALERAHADVPATPGSGQVEYYTEPLPAGAQPPPCPPRVRRMREQFKSAYYSADVQLGDSSYMHLDALDTLTAVWKNVRKGGVFSRRQYLQLDMSSANTDLHIYGLQSYRRMVPKKTWGIGLHLGYGILFDHGLVRAGPEIGIGITKSLIDF